MHDVQLGFWLDSCEDGLRQNLVRDEVARNQIQNCVLCGVHVVQDACANHQHLEAARRNRVSPAHERIAVVALDDRRSDNHDPQVSPPLLQHALGEAFREGVGVWVNAEDGFFLLSDTLRAKLDDVLDNALAILLARQVVHFLFDFLSSHDVAVDIGCGDVGEDLDFDTLFRQLEHSLAAEVVDFQCVEQRVIEAHAGCAVNDDLCLGYDHLSVRRADPKLVDDQIASNRDDPLPQVLAQTRVFLEKGRKYFRIENLLIEALLQGHVLLRTDHDEELLEVGQSPDDFLEDDFADEASAARQENRFPLVKSLDPQTVAAPQR